MSDKEIKEFSFGIMSAIYLWAVLLAVAWLANYLDGSTLGLNDIDLPYFSQFMTLILGYMIGGTWSEKPRFIAMSIIHFLLIAIISSIFYKGIPFENGKEAPLVESVQTYLNFDSSVTSFIFMHICLFIIMMLAGIGALYIHKVFKIND